MNCPDCNNTDTRILETRTRADRSVRRRHLCLACGHRFSSLERVYAKLPHPQKGQPFDRPNRNNTRKLTDQQVLAIYHADLSRTTLLRLAELHGVSKEAVRQIRSGKAHKKVIAAAVAGGSLVLCTDCKHWARNYCSMGFPDPEVEGPTFAADCSLYEASTQSISRDCPSSVQ